MSIRSLGLKNSTMLRVHLEPASYWAYWANPHGKGTPRVEVVRTSTRTLEIPDRPRTIQARSSIDNISSQLATGSGFSDI
jgi:hypothetical protein